MKAASSILQSAQAYLQNGGVAKLDCDTLPGEKQCGDSIAIVYNARWSVAMDIAQRVDYRRFARAAGAKAIRAVARGCHESAMGHAKLAANHAFTAHPELRA